MLKGHPAASQEDHLDLSPARSDGSQDDQVVEADPIELELSGGQESQN